MKNLFIGFLFLVGYLIIVSILIVYGFCLAIFFIFKFFIRKSKNIKKNTEDFFSILEDENDSIFADEAERPYR